MTDKKKKYLAPEIEVVVIDQADIIATSTQIDVLDVPSGIGLEEETW